MADFEDRRMRGSTFRHVDLTGARFDQVDLTEARLEQVDLTRALIRNADLSGTLIRGAFLDGAELDGVFDTLYVSGVDVVPLVEAELDRRHPERASLRPSDADGFRRAWQVSHDAWVPTMQRAAALAPESLHVRVADEWSFIETLRHLVFVTDVWVKRALLHDPSPYDPLDLAYDEMAEDDNAAVVPYDPGARPDLATMQRLRDDRSQVATDYLAQLTDEELAGTTDVTGLGNPAAGTYDVRRCLRALINEEWEHRLIAERDLDRL